MPSHIFRDIVQTLWSWREFSSFFFHPRKQAQNRDWVAGKPVVDRRAADTPVVDKPVAGPAEDRPVEAAGSLDWLRGKMGVEQVGWRDRPSAVVELVVVGA